VHTLSSKARPGWAAMASNTRWGRCRHARRGALETIHIRERVRVMEPRYKPYSHLRGVDIYYKYNGIHIIVF
jgi:hypothetical protein